MVCVFVNAFPNSRVIPFDGFPHSNFKKRCDIIQHELNSLQEGSEGKRLKVLWCFKHMTQITRLRSRPFNAKVSVHFMYQGFPYYDPYPSLSRLRDGKYDVVVFEEMISNVEDVLLINSLMWAINEFGGMPVVVSAWEKFPLLTLLGEIKVD